MHVSQDELDKYRQRVEELESELGEMTAALSHAWDQLVPFLQDTVPNADSPIDLMPIIQAAVAATDTRVGGIYLFAQEQWYAYPEQINLSCDTREALKTNLNPGVHHQFHSDEDLDWAFVPIVAEGVIAGALGIGSSSEQHIYDVADIRILTRMAERATSQIVTAQLEKSRQREAAAQHELQIASMIQRSTQPMRPPRLTGVEVASFWEPAKEVGGDTWGWSVRPDGSLAWFVLDVAGKGLPAALAAMSLHTAFRMGLKMGLSLTDLMQAVNEEFYDTFTTTDLMATAVILSLNPSTGVLQQANAGHPPTLVRLNNTFLQLRSTAPPIGVLTDLVVQTQRVVLQKTDLIVCYSDGLSEIETSSGLWGESGIMAALTSDKHDLEELSQHLIQTSQQVGIDQQIRDDQTLVLVRLT